MASIKNRVIVLKGDALVQTEEYSAGGAITPGHLLGWSAGALVVHAVAGGNASPLFALERDEMGKDIDTAYASGDKVKAGHFGGGMEVNALVAAAAVAIAVGDPVESAGNGTVRKHTAPANLSAAAPAYNAIVGVAREAVDNSGGGAAVRIRIAIR